MARVDSGNTAVVRQARSVAGAVARIKAALADRSDNRLAQLVAGKGFGDGVDRALPCG